MGVYRLVSEVARSFVATVTNKQCTPYTTYNMATLAFDVGIVNMALCVSENNMVRYCDVFLIGKPKDPLNGLINTLLQQLRARQESIGSVTRIVIEQQLGRAATKNFALSAVLFAYFSDHFHGVATVEFVSPRKKFKILATLCGVPGISERSEEFKTTRGPGLKKLAVQASKALAEHNNDMYFLSKLALLKKKDDCSDSHLQSLLC